MHPIRLGDERGTEVRQDAHELLERLEGRAELKVKVKLGDVAQVGDLGRVVVVVEPGPGRDAVVVVVQDPLQALDVAVRELPDVLRIVDLKLILHGQSVRSECQRTR